MASPQPLYPDEHVRGAQRRKRGSRACLSCRMRKVRCDVTQHGVPCTNCRADAQPCVIPRRSRKHRLSGDSTLHAMQLAGPAVPQQATLSPQEAGTRENDPYTEDRPRQGSRSSIPPMLQGMSPYYGSAAERWKGLSEHRSAEPSLPAAPNVETTGNVSVSSVISQAGEDNQLPEAEVEVAASTASMNTSHVPSSGTRAAQGLERPLRPTSINQVTASFYPFLDIDCISNIAREDFEYLQRIGCFELPQRDALDELVRAYFLYVHPSLPLIDEGAFWDVYLGLQSGGVCNAPRLSLLVFQAMLLVACGVVSSSTILEMGFSSVRSARVVYYRRTKALYDFGVARSSLARAQGALLMTYHVPLNEPDVNSSWLSRAIHLARVEGADRYATCPPRDRTRYNPLKRLWWCCIIRDRNLALGLRRPISISSKHFDKIWPPLTEEDMNDEVERSCVHSPPVKVKLLRSVAALCKFSRVLTNALQLLYPADGVHGTGDRFELLRRVYLYTDELNEWHDGLANHVETHDLQHKSFNVTILFTNLLDIYYQSAKAALCNYRIKLTLDQPSQFNFERLQTKSELQGALRCIAQSLRAIIGAGMMTYSPIGMVAYLALPSVCSNLDLNSRVSATATTQRATSRGAGTKIYQDFLRVLQLRYEGTDRALDNLSKLMVNMNLEDATSPSTIQSGTEHRPVTGHNWKGSTDGPPGADSLDPSRKMGSGIDVIVTDPLKYVRMCSTLDFFLSRGRFPMKHENSPDLLLWPDENERSSNSAGGSSMNGVDPAMEEEDDEETQHDHLFRPSNVSNQQSPAATVGNQVWEASAGTLESNALGNAASEGIVGPASADLSVMFTDDPFGDAAAAADSNPGNFSFADFMTDGPYSGIERLQNMLYTYPGRTVTD